MTTVANADNVSTDSLPLVPQVSENDSEAEKGRTCRDLLNVAVGWYSAAKDYVPAVAKPVVSKLEHKVGEKLEQYPDAVQRVEAFLDSKVIPTAEAAATKVAETTREVLNNKVVQERVICPGRAAVDKVVIKTKELKSKADEAVKAVQVAKKDLKAKVDSTVSRLVESGLDAADRVHDVVSAAGQATNQATAFLKQKWQSPPSRSELHASVVALATMVDDLVERTLPADAATGVKVDTDKNDDSDEVTDETPTASSVVTDTAEKQTEANDSATAAVTDADDNDEIVDASPSSESISALARNIAGKVSFRMKKRVARKLEEAKGKLKLRTEKLLHSTNLIHYARKIANDERYAKLTTVFAEAANVAKSSQEMVVRTVAETINNINVTTGVELFHKGEETARLAIVTTGEMTAKCRTYANDLAKRIRQRIAEMEAERTNTDTKLNDATPDALDAAFAKYVRATVATGAATMFVFRDDLNQVLTYAYTASSPQLTAAIESTTRPAWTALTQISQRTSKLKTALKDAATGYRQVVEQATTWTSLAISEFAKTAKQLESSQALPLGFRPGLSFIVQHMVPPAQPTTDSVATTEATVDAPTTEVDPVPATVDAVDTDVTPVEDANIVNADEEVQAEVINETVNDDDSAVAVESSDMVANTEEEVDTNVVPQPEDADSTIQLDDEQSNAE